MNYYLASQLIADRQAALTADAAHRALLKDARAARGARAKSGAWPARAATRRRPCCCLP
jgi:hypothetical protein